MNARPYPMVIAAIAATVLLSACSKSIRNDVDSVVGDNAASATAPLLRPIPEGAASVRSAAHEEAFSEPSQVRAQRVDFRLPCNGKQAGDECVLNFGGRDVRTRCVAEPDETGTMGLSCGSRRPPNAMGNGNGSHTAVDSYSPCNGKKAGDECVLRISGGEARSHCFVAADAGTGERLSCGPRPPPQRGR